MSIPKKIRVAMVAPPFGETGGPEVMIKNLSQALAEQEVAVTLFAPADWKTNLPHIPTLPQSLWSMKDFESQSPVMRRNLIVDSQIKVLTHQDKFDIIHLHSNRYAYIVASNSRVPCVLSLHNNTKLPEFTQIKQTGTKIVSLSKSQKGNLKTDATIWNGVPTDTIPYSLEKGKYLISIGRLTDQKGIDLAIQIALKAKEKFLFFGRIGTTEERKKYFDEKLKPFIDGTQIIYKEEVSHKEIYQYLANAKALLFPIRRREVCPMVIMEALATGTPVIGTAITPLPELIGQKKTIAFLSDDLHALAKVATHTDQFDRKECRRYAEKYFDSAIMAKKYIRLYKKILRRY